MIDRVNNKQNERHRDTHVTLSLYFVEYIDSAKIYTDLFLSGAASFFYYFRMINNFDQSDEMKNAIISSYCP